MKKEHSKQNSIRRILEGRAARTIVSVAAVFLCVLTLLEFMALRFEWNIPILEVLSSENGFWSEEIRNEELALDDSTENELLDEAELGSGALLKEDSVNDSDGENGISMSEKPIEESRDETSDSGEKADAVKETEAEESDENAETEAEDPEFPYYICINRKQNCITIYTMDEQGEYTVPYKAMICSTGLYNATPRGTFQISTKYRWRELYGGVYGQYATRIHGGVLFHSVPYYKKSESALCTEKYNKLGQQASMGCVRLTVEDAKWIAENCPAGTTVEIYDDDEPGPLGKPESVKIDTDNPNKGWDPTDPNEKNPWHEVSKDE